MLRPFVFSLILSVFILSAAQAAPQRPVVDSGVGPWDTKGPVGGLTSAHEIEAWNDIHAIKAAAMGGDPNAQFALAESYEFGDGVTRDREQAFHWFKKAAEHGNPYAIGALGEFYEYGDFVEQDLEKAAKNYWIAAEVNSPWSAFRLALLYLDGHGVNQDYSQTYFWTKSAVDAGYAPALTTLAWLYAHGHGIQKDFDKAVALHEEAAERGVSNVYSSLGALYEKHEEYPKRYVKARELYEKGIEQFNDGKAKAYLAELYLNGKGGVQNDDKARELFEAAAEDGISYAFNHLARAYQFGTLYELDLPLARFYYRKAALANNVDALERLGTMYLNGRGGPVDLKEALWLYRRAESLGSDYATFSIGYLHEIGVDGERNWEKALELYHSIKNEIPEAYGYIGFAYEHGYGTEKNLETAESYYRKGAELDDVYAQVRLASLYVDHDRGISPQTLKEIKAYLTQAIESGDADALTYYAYLFDPRFNGFNDEKLALKYYEKAAKAGSVFSALRLFEFYKEGSESEKNKAYEFYELAGLNGDVEAALAVGKTKVPGSRPVSQVDLYMKAAEQGDVRGQVLFGITQLDGHAGQKTDATGRYLDGIRHLQEAFEKNPLVAAESLKSRAPDDGRIDLGYLPKTMAWEGAFLALLEFHSVWDSGLGVQKEDLLRVGVDNLYTRDKNAFQFTLAMLLVEKAESDEEVLEEAIMHLNILANAGYRSAQFLLADLYFHGELVEQRLATVKLWDGINKEYSSDSQARLAYIALMEEEISLPERKQAFKELVLAAETGSPVALELLSKHLSNKPLDYYERDWLRRLQAAESDLSG
ncbi:tetratricopeptide repeat protein [Flexibacterium corallicola]|uniref:tetratricopeptide repeat protein n=1 Tax=Flexibacterium corallicola TaxID=3037259 RepID=UPI00286F9DC1|nr:tetratricopeptide repeat protein [Pseudovibrio sp. M1P-2-3]